jgi:hypothetical protein
MHFWETGKLQLETWEASIIKLFTVGIKTAVLNVLVSTRNLHPSLLFAIETGVYLYKDGKYKSLVDSAKGTRFLENIYTRKMFNSIGHRWQQYKQFLTILT